MGHLVTMSLFANKNILVCRAERVYSAFNRFLKSLQKQLVSFFLFLEKNVI